MTDKQIKINVKNRKDLISKIIGSLQKNRKPTVFLYLNSGSYYYKTVQSDYEQAIKASDYIYLNSYYLGLFIKCVFHKNFEKINAEDFIFELLQICESRKKRVFILGAKNVTNERAVNNLKSKYKKLAITGYGGYFKNDSDVLNKLDSFKPHIIIVGLGSGLQEPWILRNAKKINRPVSIIAVGNYIDVLGNSRQLPPKLLREMELEWLYRLIKEPRRLWKRYFFGLFISLKEVILSGRSKNPQN